MEQIDRGSYKTNGTLAHEFFHSCLGKLVILAAFFGALLVIAYFTVPNKETMMAEMSDNIIQCIEDNDSIKTDWIDDAVNNIGYIFTEADTPSNPDIISNFEKYNKLEYYDHTFYATTLLHNNFKPEGIRVGVGVFGVVFPTVNFNDFLFRIGPMHKGYDQKIIQRTVIKGSSSFADNPELGL
jgi:hypothetical protein